MNERIAQLTELTLSGAMYVDSVETEFDREDIFLPRMEMETKRLCEYIVNQEPKLTEYSCFTGKLAFNTDSVVGDAYLRRGHAGFSQVTRLFYLKPIDHLSTFEAQHATGDYHKVLQSGIRGIIDEIDASLLVHTDPEKISFLLGLKKVAYALIEWAHKCAERTEAFAETVEDDDYKRNLRRLSDALRRVPENPPTDFYEAVLTLYVCFSANPDSFGTLDRYLYSFYKDGIDKGTLTREEAAEYLQEFFLMAQACTPVTSPNFSKGGNSHFCVGGYLANGEDGYNELSELIIESMVDLPTYIPEVTLRWTKKTPREVLKHVMDLERKDPHKRIAFTNDDKRMQCFVEFCGIPFERAVNYTLTGCNEPALLGAISASTSKGNLLHSVESLFHCYAEKAVKAETFDEFYSLYETVLYQDLDIIYDYDDKYNLERGKDINYISSLFSNGCIKSATSLTQGGCDHAIATPMMCGVTNTIDSLIVVKQFVYDEKVCTMETLIEALHQNWSGYEDLRTVILRKGHFFGNDDELSNSVSQRLYHSLYRYLKGKRSVYGYPIVIGDILGYNQHHKIFGQATKATPDGRYNGENLKFGLGQSEGRDRNGLTAYLNSVAQIDPNAVTGGSTVTNVSLDERLVKDDAHFDKLVTMMETYFKNGGMQFQLSYVSRDELLAAKKSPEKYRNLRVRVTGFSDYFVNLTEDIQNSIIARTSPKE